MIIIGISGAKKSGKSTLAKAIADNCYDAFHISRPGDTREYPLRKVHRVAFADPIKKIAVEWLGVDPAIVYGTDEDKARLCGYRWEQMPHYEYLVKKLGLDAPFPDQVMTGREILQELGTGVFRHMFQGVFCRVWRQTVDEIGLRDPLGVVVTDDVRFPNEVKTVLGYRRFYDGEPVEPAVYRLARGKTDDAHESETALDSFLLEGFDILQNCELNQFETFSLFVEQCDFIHPRRKKIIFDRYMDNLMGDLVCKFGD